MLETHSRFQDPRYVCQVKNPQKADEILHRNALTQFSDDADYILMRSEQASGLFIVCVHGLFGTGKTFGLRPQLLQLAEQRGIPAAYFDVQSLGQINRADELKYMCTPQNFPRVQNGLALLDEATSIHPSQVPAVVDTLHARGYRTIVPIIPTISNQYPVTDLEPWITYTNSRSASCADLKISPKGFDKGVAEHVWANYGVPWHVIEALLFLGRTRYIAMATYFNSARSVQDIPQILRRLYDHYFLFGGQAGMGFTKEEFRNLEQFVGLQMRNLEKTFAPDPIYASFL